jgi:hypothetical protein
MSQHHVQIVTSQRHVSTSCLNTTISTPQVGYSVAHLVIYTTTPNIPRHTFNRWVPQASAARCMHQLQQVLDTANGKTLPATHLPWLLSCQVPAQAYLWWSCDIGLHKTQTNAHLGHRPTISVPIPSRVQVPDCVFATLPRHICMPLFRHLS